MKPGETLKVQPTLKGYGAWVIVRLSEVKGETQAEVAKYLFDRWADDNQQWLAGFGASRDDFQLARDRAAVIPLKASSDSFVDPRKVSDTDELG